MIHSKTSDLKDVSIKSTFDLNFVLTIGNFPITIKTEIRDIWELDDFWVAFKYKGKDYDLNIHLGETDLQASIYGLKGDCIPYEINTDDELFIGNVEEQL